MLAQIRENLDEDFHDDANLPQRPILSPLMQQLFLGQVGAAPGMENPSSELMNYLQKQQRLLDRVETQIQKLNSDLTNPKKRTDESESNRLIIIEDIVLQNNQLLKQQVVPVVKRITAREQEQELLSEKSLDNSPAKAKSEPEEEVKDLPNMWGGKDIFGNVKAAPKEKPTADKLR